MADKIGKVKTQNEFPKLYQAWLQNHAHELTEAERYQWLSCLYHYVKIDTNGNGIPDWSALVDQQPAKVLYSQDPDQDGDGIPNVYDSDPLNAKVGEKIISTEIPTHLKIKRPAVAELQKKLFTEYGIIAIDHTDRHSAVVLSALITLLEKGFPKKFSLKDFRYVYAFSGHDPKRNVASYHLQAQALSVAGVTSYSEPEEGLAEQDRVDLIAALAHEIGHAILFEKLTSKDLSEISVKYGKWNPMKLLGSFFFPGFFTSYPHGHGENIVSQYSMTNRHEWFAESFAATMLNKLGRHGFLGEKWHQLLAKYPTNQSDYWVDYNNITDEFRHWLELLIER